MHDRGCCGVSGERECERKENDGVIKMQERRERENRYWTEREERRCRMCPEESETIEHMWSGCDEIREREGREQREILSEDGRGIGWMKEVWKRRERERWEYEFKKVMLGSFWNCHFLFVFFNCKESESP
jgi:hypothetical protein